jgi:D-isomer specific 2-hydroxyacid dehydrogenase, NAD binding domain
MKRGAYFINIAHGRCVVTDDLITALRSGQLAGARLEVADPEPLPPDSPLREMPNVPITPHVAILGAPHRQNWEAILIENCRVLPPVSLCSTWSTRRRGHRAQGLSLFPEDRCEGSSTTARLFD